MSIIQLSTTFAKEKISNDGSGRDTFRFSKAGEGLLISRLKSVRWLKVEKKAYNGFKISLEKVGLRVVDQHGEGLHTIITPQPQPNRS